MNKRIFFILLCICISILLLTGCFEKAEAEDQSKLAVCKEFIPGEDLRPYLDRLILGVEDRFQINEILVDDLKKADVRLVKSFGPNGEEALKLSTGKQTGFIEVGYYPQSIYGNYKVSFEYKSDVITDSPENGARIKTRSNVWNFLTVPLENTDEWKTVEFITHTTKQQIEGIYFILGTISNSSTSGTIYFTNFSLEKLEE